MLDEYAWLDDDVMAAVEAEYVDWVVRLGSPSSDGPIALADTCARYGEGEIRLGSLPHPIRADALLARYRSWQSRQSGAASVAHLSAEEMDADVVTVGAVSFAPEPERCECQLVVGDEPCPLCGKQGKQTAAEFWFGTDQAHRMSLAQRAARDAERERREREWAKCVAEDQRTAMLTGMPNLMAVYDEAFGTTAGSVSTGQLNLNVDHWRREIEKAMLIPKRAEGAER